MILLFNIIKTFSNAVAWKISKIKFLINKKPH